jgi:FtsP/CotA-like multicopper oxidase with cupredoxin domain
MGAAQYWYIGVIVAVVILLIVILVMLLTLNSNKNKPVCKSAEYPTVAENLSCDPNVVEISLTASDNEVQILSGDATRLYNYNKSFPGPLIEAKVGDTLIVNFFNDISEPSSITWHGLLTPANMDGSQISAEPIQPGASFVYRFKLGRAGLYWYHSDINSREQVSMGLFGVILVKDFEADTCYSMPTVEKVLAFSDLKLDGANQVDIEFSSIPEERIEQEVNGILGNVLLTNGVYDGCINLTKNIPVRLYLVNCATDRFMKIFLEGHDMLRVGGDQGLLDRPVLIKENNGLVLTTGERAEVVFVPRRDNIKLYTESNVRGLQKVIKDECGNCELSDHIDHESQKIVLVTFISTNHADVEEEKDEQLAIPLHLSPIKKIRTDNCTPIIPVNFRENISCGYSKFSAYEKTPFPQLSKKQAPIIFEGGTYIIEVTNKSALPNNFYLHGFTFQHIDTIFVNENGEKQRIENSLIENKDTIYIPARPDSNKKCKKSKTVVRLAVTFSSKKGRDIQAYGKEPTDCRSGGWIFQSHILTYAHLGQEGFIQIVAECERSNMNSYSSYSSGDHSTCLTSFSKTKSSKSYSSSSSNSLDEITKSLVTCKCGSGKSALSCCSSSSTFSTNSSSTFSTNSSSTF